MSLTNKQLLALVRFVEAHTGRPADSDHLQALYAAFDFGMDEDSLPDARGDAQGEARRWRVEWGGCGRAELWHVVDQFGVAFRDPALDVCWCGGHAAAIALARQLNSGSV